MRTCILLLTLLSFTAAAADPSPVDSGVATRILPADLPAAPLEPAGTDGPLVLLPNGLPAPGKSVHLEKGEPAPYPGWLPDAQEHIRREKINEKNAAKLKDYETGNVIISTPAFIGILLGVAAVFAGGAVAITKVTEKKP